jgi:hypothetical protein
MASGNDKYGKVLLENLGDLYSLLSEHGAESVLPTAFVVELERQGVVSNSDYMPGEILYNRKQKERQKRQKYIAKQLEKKFGKLRKRIGFRTGMMINLTLTHNLFVGLIVGFQGDLVMPQSILNSISIANRQRIGTWQGMTLTMPLPLTSR